MKKEIEKIIFEFVGEINCQLTREKLRKKLLNHECVHEAFLKNTDKELSGGYVTQEKDGSFKTTNFKVEMNGIDINKIRKGIL